MLKKWKNRDFSTNIQIVMVENVEIKTYNVEKSVEKVKNSGKIGCKLVEKKFCNNVDKL